MFGRKMVRDLIRHTGLDKEMANRPKGKRSVSVAKKGKKTDRCYGNRRSYCLSDRKGVQKKEY